jgi:hypothetical protein
MGHDAWRAMLVTSRDLGGPPCAALAGRACVGRELCCGRRAPLVSSPQSGDRCSGGGQHVTRVAGRTGWLAARVGGARPWAGAARVVFWGALAMAVTAVIGALFGTVV